MDKGIWTLFFWTKSWVFVSFFYYCDYCYAPAFFKYNYNGALEIDVDGDSDDDDDDNADS